MPVVMIGDYGKNSEGVHTFRINTTTKDDIYTILKESKEMGFRFWETPNIEKVHKTYSVLLKLYVPKDMGYPEESSGSN